MNYNLNLLNSQPQLSIPISNLLVTPYEIRQLLEVKIQQKINEHGMLYLKGILSNAQEENYAELSTKGTNVALSALDAYGEEYIVFQGVVKDVSIQVAQEIRYIEVHAISYSYLLDVEKKSRSFQNKKNSYTDLAKQVTADYAAADVIDVVTNGVPTNKFIVQHMETDWEFLKRLASHFHTGLICDVRFDVPKYFFGIPEVPALELDNTDYSVKKDMQRFNRLSENGVTGLKEHDFICYEVETKCLMRIADAVMFRKKKLYVSEITSFAHKGLFISRLVLMPKKGLSQLHKKHNNIVGASFGGHILESKNDQVKVTLDIDKGHDPGEPCFFPYSTIYSSQDGSGWYCMPETGDTVRIYCPDGEDDHAYAISSVHEQVDEAELHQRNSGANASGGSGGGGMRGSGGAGDYSGQRDDPSVKSLTYGDKEIRLTPEGVYIIMDSAMITLTDEGITMMCENDIAFKSDKNIMLCAEEDVNIVGDSGVEIMCGDTAGILIEENVQVVGQEVHAN